MATSQASQIVILNDFVSLPIIISDYDAIAENKRRASGATSSTTTSPETKTSSPPTNPSHQQWGTGFSAYADELWECMTTGMKQKLREAESQATRMSWQFDDDARFLD
ncbi:hypothetical protein LTR09_005595 [Extremus antarcticus]|uniref:Uncharacterized protein n=1 Tax=Extremus antarcticus TaxID=702011 RepID=A0AAJ0DNW3_9PEZI|nr:hypothetical protein LTR09_005595 [Extremus antarcticus]